MNKNIFLSLFLLALFPFFNVHSSLQSLAGKDWNEVEEFLAETEKEDKEQRMKKKAERKFLRRDFYSLGIKDQETWLSCYGIHVGIDQKYKECCAVLAENREKFEMNNPNTSFDCDECNGNEQVFLSSPKNSSQNIVVEDLDDGDMSQMSDEGSVHFHDPSLFEDDNQSDKKFVYKVPRKCNENDVMHSNFVDQSGQYSGEKWYEKLYRKALSFVSSKGVEKEEEQLTEEQLTEEEFSIKKQKEEMRYMLGGVSAAPSLKNDENILRYRQKGAKIKKSWYCRLSSFWSLSSDDKIRATDEVAGLLEEADEARSKSIWGFMSLAAESLVIDKWRMATGYYKLIVHGEEAFREHEREWRVYNIKKASYWVGYDQSIWKGEGIWETVVSFMGVVTAVAAAVGGVTLTVGMGAAITIISTIGAAIGAVPALGIAYVANRAAGWVGGPTVGFWAGLIAFILSYFGIVRFIYNLLKRKKEKQKEEVYKEEIEERQKFSFEDLYNLFSKDQSDLEKPSKKKESNFLPFLITSFVSVVAAGAYRYNNNTKLGGGLSTLHSMYEMQQFGATMSTASVVSIAQSIGQRDLLESQQIDNALEIERERRLSIDFKKNNMKKMKQLRETQIDNDILQIDNQLYWNKPQGKKRQNLQKRRAELVEEKKQLCERQQANPFDSNLIDDDTPSLDV